VCEGHCPHSGIPGIFAFTPSCYFSTCLHSQCVRFSTCTSPPLHCVIQNFALTSATAPYSAIWGQLSMYGSVNHWCRLHVLRSGHHPPSSLLQHPWTPLRGHPTSTGRHPVRWLRTPYSRVRIGAQVYRRQSRSIMHTYSKMC
jgi:hypothetical protein